MKQSYVTCKRCGFTIQLPFECRFEYPLHFAVKCQRCGYVNVYHRLEVIQENDKYCEEANERAEKLARPLREIFMLLETGAMIQPQFETLLNISQRIKEKLERGDIGGSKDREDKIRGQETVSSVPNPQNLNQPQWYNSRRTA